MLLVRASGIFHSWQKVKGEQTSNGTWCEEGNKRTEGRELPSPGGRHPAVHEGSSPTTQHFPPGPPPSWGQISTWGLEGTDIQTIAQGYSTQYQKQSFIRELSPAPFPGHFPSERERMLVLVGFLEVRSTDGRYHVTGNASQPAAVGRKEVEMCWD